MLWNVKWNKWNWIKNEGGREDFFCPKNTRRRRTIFGEEKYFRKENICGWIAACIQKAKEGMKPQTKQMMKKT